MLKRKKKSAKKKPTKKPTKSKKEEKMAKSYKITNNTPASIKVKYKGGGSDKEEDIPAGGTKDIDTDIGNDGKGTKFSISIASDVTIKPDN
jgi:hypothetical protein